MQVNGKSIIVTGGTDGIGLRMARQLKAKGATVTITGRTPTRVEAARAEGFDVIAVDLSTHAGIDTLVAALADKTIDILINNAGTGELYDLRKPDAINLDTQDLCLFLNISAPIHLITRLMPALRARPEAMIVNVTSGLAIAPNTGSPIYCATKAALRSYTMAIRAQLKGTNIRVLEAMPPLVDTRMTAGRGSNKMSPEACAAQIVSAIERGATEANVGMVKVLRTVYSISPALARAIMLKF
jgi:uncharacterized oxidoreductase